MLGYCIFPIRLVLSQWAFWFQWTLIVQKSTTSYSWIYSKKSEEFACVYTCTCIPLWNKKQVCCLYFCVRVSNALDTGAECDYDDANIAVLGLDNQCMAQIPLTENPLASQLMINSIFLKSDFLSLFFMLTGVGLGEVKQRQWSHCLTPMFLLKSQHSPNSLDQQLMFSQHWKGKKIFGTLLQNVGQCSRLVVRNIFKAWKRILGDFFPPSLLLHTKTATCHAATTE